MDQRIVILHGFTNEEAAAALTALKGAIPAAKDAAFATTTATNMGWKVADLVAHIAEEHRQYKEMQRKKG